MNLFKKLNVIIGWVIFIIATIVYFLTLEPTASWWDCGEYISTAYKLQVGHPPGAPLFQLLGRFFSLFAFGDTSKVAMMINAMSALSSSFTILFLFWTITIIAKKLVMKSAEDFKDKAKIIAVFSSAAIGSLAYTFSDSFWFSAVEGEVYAMSSLFTAVVFWAILRWEEADDIHSKRWLILIAYFMGLSIGVHLLNLLAIPAIAVVYYLKKYKATWKGVVYTLIISILLLAFIMYLLIPGVVKLSSNFELVFVNSLGLPFNSGTIIYFLLLIGLIVGGLYYTARKQKAILNLILISFTFILIGYSSFFMLIIRAQANTPINENDPRNAISMLSYLNREQYGTWPIFFGQYYNAPVVDYGDESPVYIKDKKKGKYVITDKRESSVPIYDDRFMTFFPRMWSSQKKEHAELYQQYGKIKGYPIQVDDDGETKTLIKPTFAENLRFFFTYQVGHMYFRYFMWNFSGRQNDVESQGEVDNGNWLTGFNWFDENILGLGPQDNLPDSMKSHARNEFFLLPFLLGMVGFFYHLNRSKKGALIVFLLFFMTGFAIIVYLNQTPLQPRERDYSYAGSFYAFAIWIGLGILALWDGLKKWIPSLISVVAVSIIALILVPGIMAKEGWGDHDRSGKYAARDFAANYLNSCAPNAILITNGDNDTFPLWYAQEVEGIRTDVRVVNFMLSSGHWYIHQLMRQVYDSKALPFTLDYDQYENGVNNAVVFQDMDLPGPLELDDAIGFIASRDERSKLQLNNGESIAFLPTKSLKITIDSATLMKTGTVPAEMAPNIVKEINWKVKQSYLYKNDLMLLDFIATNDWQRPIYFANPNSISRVFNVDEYCHLEGFVYRFLPVKAKNHVSSVGGVSAETSYDILMNKCKWGNLNDPDVTVDRESMRNSIIPKQNFMRVAEALVIESKMLEMGVSMDNIIQQNLTETQMEENMKLAKVKKEKAIKLLDRCFEVFPDSKFPFDMYMVPFAETYYDAGAIEKGNKIASRVFEIYKQNIIYYNRCSLELQAYFQSDFERALGIIQRLSSTAEKYKQTKLQKEFDDFFNEQITRLER